MSSKFRQKLVKTLKALRSLKLKTLAKISRSKQEQEGFVVSNCSYLPEEIILAFGKTLIHIEELKSSDFDKVELFISCSPFASLNDKGKKLTERIGKSNYFYFKQAKEDELGIYQNTVKALLDFLEQRYQRNISCQKLFETTKLMNETRYILSRLAEIRRVNVDFIDLNSWEELLHYSWILPRKVFNKHGKKLLRHLGYVAPRAEQEVNYVLCKSNNEDTHKLKRILEERGTPISYDIESKDFCRFSKMIPAKTPILETISKAYFNQYPSISFSKSKDRSEIIERYVKQFNASGVIYCIPNAESHYDQEIAKLKEHGIAIIALKLAQDFKDFIDLTFVKHSPLTS